MNSKTLVCEVAILVLVLTAFGCQGGIFTSPKNAGLLTRGNNIFFVWNYKESPHKNGTCVDEDTLEGIDEPKGKRESCDCNDVNEEDVYWRLWQKKIPKDALRAGYILENIPVYLAQAYFPSSGVQPVALMDKATYVMAPHHGIKYTKKNINVLCSRNKELVVWVPISETGQLSFETDCVEAGTENGYPLYFGKCTYENVMYVGKVVAQEKSMYFAHEMTLSEQSITENFDVLCYRNAAIKNNITVPAFR